MRAAHAPVLRVVRGVRWASVLRAVRGVRWASVLRVVRGVRWYLRELTGEAEYDRHCERHRRRHPHAPVPTRREYQLLRARHQEDHAGSRCC